MEANLIEKRIEGALVNCKYESDVSKAMREMLPILRAEFSNEPLTAIMYYLEKVTIAKKKAIRHNIIG